MPHIYVYNGIKAKAICLIGCGGPYGYEMVRLKYFFCEIKTTKIIY
jgi:hypothetical protein